MLRKEIEKDHPYISVVVYGGKEYVGIIINQDQYITSLLNYAACRSMTDKKQLLELGKTWWMESNRLIPITIFLHSELEKLKYCQINMNTKDVQILTGPTVNLSNINVKRIKRKNIQLVRKPKK
tara:strand:- start:4625 stop:4996 length:372 start_codon:yes stop_codon:yes gene_type:complete